MAVRTFKFRIKDASSRKHLCRLAGSVNYTWNQINLTTQSSDSFLSNYQVDNLFAGFCKKIKLHSTTVQAISAIHYTCRKEAHKSKLKWRSAKRDTLGWIPFKASALKLDQEICTVTYMKQSFKYYFDKRKITGKILTGCFVQDSRERWYVCLQVKEPEVEFIHPEPEVGIDLGMKEKISLSNGEIFTRESLTKRYASKLAKAQRACKAKQVTRIHDKIKNSRNDWAQKATTKICERYRTIFVGDLKSGELVGESPAINRAIYDSAFGTIKILLMQKASRLGGEVVMVDEAWTTQTCSSCLSVSGPRGESQLGTREWICKDCGKVHKRDENAAKNMILFSKRPDLRPRGRKKEAVSDVIR